MVDAPANRPSDGSNMMNHVLASRLAALAQSHRRWRLLRALTTGWLLVGALAAAVILIYAFTGWRSSWPFPVLLLVAVTWTVISLWRTRTQPDDTAAVVRRIEAEHPELRALLRTAVEQTPDPTSGELNYLQLRVLNDVLSREESQNWQASRLRRLDRMQILHGVVLMLVCGFLGALFLMSLRSFPFAGLSQNGVIVTPGDAELERGSSLVVLAKFSGAIPTEATLIVRPANEPEQRLPLTRNLDDPVFGTSLPNVRAELTYRIEFGADRTRDFKITTFDYPQLERADAKVTYPTYTGLTEKTIEDTRRVSAVEGSALQYTFHLNKPIRHATLVPKSGPTLPMQADTNRPNVYLSDFRLEQSGRYELILVDDAGRTNKLPPLFVLEALSNRPPDLKFAFPKGDQRVSALEEITFQAEATDDFGLKGYGLAYNLAGQETKLLTLGTNAGPLEKRVFNHLVALETLGAQPDQLLSYYLWAEDIGPDGNPRRVTSDMFFAEIRPFEEIFRESQGQEANQSQQQQQQGQQGQNTAERLAEMQKQIISATWNLQRRETGSNPTPNFKTDATTIKESQASALEQVRRNLTERDDPRSTALLEGVANEMARALDYLTTAVEANAPRSLPDALAAEQSAYQALLRLASRETQVAQGQPGQPGQSSRGQRAQRQLDQLDLRQSQNRYETERQAAPPQDPQQREQLQAFNRLKELAQRQQDVNERLRELQAALQAAQTETEREELRARLKRLQEEQQQMLADVDELRQRMDRSENQSQMAEAREQMEQTREEVQRAAEAMERGDVAQALSSGTRAQRDLQEMRDDFRRESSSQFAEDMRELRQQARELAEQQNQIGEQLDALNDPSQRKSLTDSEERQNLATRLDEQKQRREELVKQATEVTQKAEPVEPLLARQLYETIRQAAQDDARNLQETSDDLLTQGRLRTSVYEQLRESQREGEAAVSVAANLLRGGFSAEADNLEQRARQSINDFKTGIERAAESVLGDDTEALRLARNELDELSRQLDRELAQAQRQANTNRIARDRTTSQSGTNRQELLGWDGNQPPYAESQPRAQNESPSGQPGQSQRGETQQPGEGQRQAQNESQRGQGQQRESQTGQGQQGSQPGSQQAESGQRGPGGEGNQPGENEGQRQEEQQVATTDQSSGNAQTGQRGGNQDGQREGNRPRGGQSGGSFLDQFRQADNNDYLGGPLTGPGYSDWSDRLRDVEEMLDLPELRAEAARIRDRARATRQDLQRHAREPQWDLVRLEIAGPLMELRNRVSEELARRETPEANVPIDRDPVPRRYSELVRRYYEELGRSGSAPAPAPENSSR